MPTHSIPCKAGIIDTDVHLDNPLPDALKEFLPREYRELGFGGIGALGGHRGSGNPLGVTRRDVDWQAADHMELTQQIKREIIYDSTL